MNWQEVFAIIVEIIRECQSLWGFSREEARAMLLDPDKHLGRIKFENAVRKKLGIRFLQWRRGKRDEVMGQIYRDHGDRLTPMLAETALSTAEEEE